ncbi:MAG: hypothetical protein JWR69_1834, partial [Pedosphaera sp.]|nr:hypothetical protein [Pedosphaera sp.]
MKIPFPRKGGLFASDPARAGGRRARCSLTEDSTTQFLKANFIGWKSATSSGHYFSRLVYLIVFALALHLPLGAADLPLDDTLPLRMPAIGDHQLRLLSPTLFELLLITTKQPDPATVTQWNFVDASGNSTLPAPAQFLVTTNGQSVAVQSVGFKRRVLYAPLTQRDLRIGNYLY